MFHVLAMLADQMDLKLHVVHVNHQLRGEAADQDQEFVEQLCLGAGVPLDVIVFDCAKYAKDMGITTEEAGRIKRILLSNPAVQMPVHEPMDSCSQNAAASSY